MIEEYKKMELKDLRELAILKIDKDEIFENYKTYEIERMTKRELLYMLKVEEEYLKLKRSI